ncbi:hypothetical protein ACIQ8D_36980 [Streptomyces sp. NPDC096094]|uniref:hypothetical protein n=1 Tax=Streptomyces sp. NPDC096094 TaxID=3366073 RepID=UPI0037FF2D49
MTARRSTYLAIGICVVVAVWAARRAFAGGPSEKGDQLSEDRVTLAGVINPTRQESQILAESSDPYENTPTSVVYDIFTEVYGQLVGRYTELSDAAGGAEQERWWERVIALRDEKRAVPAFDREQLIAHIKQWTDEMCALERAE